MIVMKFGGSSVGDGGRMVKVAQLSGASRAKSPMVVVSAMNGVTDTLISAANAALSGDLVTSEALIVQLTQRHLRAISEAKIFGEDAAMLQDQVELTAKELSRWAQGIALLRELTPRTLDAFIAAGELLSAPIVAGALRAQGFAAIGVDPRELMYTDDTFGAALPDEKKIAQAIDEKILPLLRRGVTPITGGFVGQAPNGHTTTLGRGGSDYSAALFGAAAKASAIEIWTDVDGILTADPRVVKGAKLLQEISYAEAAEMAFFGAKVLHPATIRPAVQENIPVWIKNTFHPEIAGTVVRADAPNEGVRALAARRGVHALFISSPKMLLAHGFAARVFQAFERLRVPVDVITTSEVSISVTVDERSPIDAILQELSLLAEVQHLPGLGVLSAVGKNLRTTKGIAAKLFTALQDINIVMISQGASDTNITLVLAEGDIPEAMRRLHQTFFESRAGLS